MSSTRWILTGLMALGLAVPTVAEADFVVDPGMIWTNDVSYPKHLSDALLEVPDQIAKRISGYEKVKAAGLTVKPTDVTVRLKQQDLHWKSPGDVSLDYKGTWSLKPNVAGMLKGVWKRGTLLYRAPVCHPGVGVTGGMAGVLTKFGPKRLSRR